MSDYDDTDLNNFTDGPPSQPPPPEPARDMGEQVAPLKVEVSKVVQSNLAQVNFYFHLLQLDK